MNEPTTRRLVDRLRDSRDAVGYDEPLMHEAAAEIERLQAEVLAQTELAKAADKHRIEALREIAATASEACATLRDRALDFLNAWDDDDELEGWSQRASQAAEALRRELR